MSAPVILGSFSIVEKTDALGQAGADVEVIPMTPGYDMRATVEHVEHCEGTRAVSFSVIVTPHPKPRGGQGVG